MERKIFNELTKQVETYILVKELNRVNNGIFYLYTKESSKVVIKELINKIDEEQQKYIKMNVIFAEDLEIIK